MLLLWVIFGVGMLLYVVGLIVMIGVGCESYMEIFLAATMSIGGLSVSFLVSAFLP